MFFCCDHLNQGRMASLFWYAQKINAVMLKGVSGQRNGSGGSVGWVQNVLDEIGLDGRRLSIRNTSSGNGATTDKILQETVAVLTDLGPNPAA
jgi:coenzyme F420-reducing hydrogenase delta subunit